MKVLFALAEAFPFIKAGGLGDVGGSLPKALQSEEVETTVIMPRYSSIPNKLFKGCKCLGSFDIYLSWRKVEYKVLELYHEEVRYLFIENEFYFNREKLYGYEDDGERFAFFSLAVLESLGQISYQPDIIHCHDWHTSLIPLLLKEKYAGSEFHKSIKTVLTIHNLKHQGVVPGHYFDDVLGLSNHTNAFAKLEYYGNLNFFKGGILDADFLTTVSPSYALEITHPYYGETLDGVLRWRFKDLIGILNGIDKSKFDPRTDENIKVKYKSSYNKKMENKAWLQKSLGLPVDKNIPVIAFISRLVEQKGVDLINHIMEELLVHEVQVIILGTGEARYEEALRYFESKYHDKMRGMIMYDEAFAHQLYAGADILMMPSKFEPCGLSQMIAMSYGTIPVVRETGGLKDSVIPYNKYTGVGNGFSFANYNAHEFLFTLKEALRIYTDDKEGWNKVFKQALNTDFSWKKSAELYLQCYRNLVGI